MEADAVVARSPNGQTAPAQPAGAPARTHSPVALVLMGHGSRDPEGAEELAALAAAVQAEAPEFRVWGGVLEFPNVGLPSIQDSFDLAVAGGARTVLAVPLLLNDAGHARLDIPREVAVARARHVETDIRLCPPLGFDPLVLQIAEGRARTLGDQVPGNPAETAVLLVGRGTSHADANADFFRTARLFWERNRPAYRWVECCFVSLAEPGVAGGIDRCARLGARRVLVVPYFINTGILAKRIPGQVEEGARAWRGLRTGVAAHFGVDRGLVRAILARARSGLDASKPAIRVAASRVRLEATP